jgi:flagellar hook protein FlgE
MFSAISGLKNHQTFMDVVANNIANVNTTGYKQSRVTFQDILSQTVRGASGAQAGLAGINAEQIGLGVGLSGIDTIQSQGTLQSTGKLTDMAISGDGYFVMSNGTLQSYTRDGSFNLATNGDLVSPSSGLNVQGWQANALGVITTTVPPTNINIPLGTSMIGKASTTLGLTGNLNSVPKPITIPVTPNPSVSVTLYDTLGNAVPITMSAAEGVPGAGAGGGTVWTFTAVDAAGAAVVPAYTAAVLFNTAGNFVSVVPAPSVLSTVATPGSVTPVTVTVDFSKLTQLASPNNLLPPVTDGVTAGSLTSFTVSPGGQVTGVYSNGYKPILAQIGMASFANPTGLVKDGANMYESSANSGAAQVGVPNLNGRGTIAAGFLEGSNVDLAQQFTNMIMAERGFQANSKVITTSDEILQDLVNLKR